MKKIYCIVSTLVLTIFLCSCEHQELFEPVAEKQALHPAGGSLSDGSDDTLSAFEVAVLQQVNAIRAKGCKCGDKQLPAVKALSWNTKLEMAAAAHADDMRTHNYFSHTSRDGRSLRDRVTQAGYTLLGYRSLVVGENIARGQYTPEQVLADWLESPSHCESLMNETFTEVAVARNGNYWVQNFGNRIPY